MNAQKLVEGFVETAEVGVHERAEAGRRFRRDR